MLQSTVKKSKSTADSDVAVIIEFGSHTLKCGIAGDDNPSLLTSSFIKKHHGQYYGGNEISQIDQGEVIRSFEARKVVNVAAWEMVWEYGLTSMDKPHNDCCLVLMSDKDRAIREKAIQIGFEQWDTPAFYLSDPGVTAIYAAGVTSATLIDVGYDTVSIGVVYEGKDHEAFLSLKYNRIAYKRKRKILSLT
jgi:actin-related protein